MRYHGGTEKLTLFYKPMKSTPAEKQHNIVNDGLLEEGKKKLIPGLLLTRENWGEKGATSTTG